MRVHYYFGLTPGSSQVPSSLSSHISHQKCHQVLGTAHCRAGASCAPTCTYFFSSQKSPRCLRFNVHRCQREAKKGTENPSPTMVGSCQGLCGTLTQDVYSHTARQGLLGTGCRTQHLHSALHRDPAAPFSFISASVQAMTLISSP